VGGARLALAKRDELRARDSESVTRQQLRVRAGVVAADEGGGFAYQRIDPLRRAHPAMVTTALLTPLAACRPRLPTPALRPRLAPIPIPTLRPGPRRSAPA